MLEPPTKEREREMGFVEMMRDELPVGNLYYTGQYTITQLPKLATSLLTVMVALSNRSV